MKKAQTSYETHFIGDMFHSLSLAEHNETAALELFYDTAHRNRKCPNCDHIALQPTKDFKHIVCTHCKIDFKAYDYTLFEGLDLPAHKIIALIHRIIKQRFPFSNISSCARELSIDRRTVGKVNKILRSSLHDYKTSIGAKIENGIIVFIREKREAIRKAIHEIREIKKHVRQVHYINFIDHILRIPSQDNVQK